MKRLYFHVVLLFSQVLLLVSGINSGHAQVPPGLIFHLPLEGDANDASGNGHHASVVNVTFGPRSESDAGLVALFTGQLTDWIEIPGVPAFASPGITISTWCYNKRTNNSDVRFLCGGAYGSKEIHFGHPSQPEAGLRWIPTIGQVIDTLNPVPIRQWFHLVCVAGPGATNGLIYINGQPVPTTGGNGVTNNINVDVSRFAIGMRGGNPGWGHLDGKVSSFRMFNRVLSADEVLQLYSIDTLPGIQLFKAVRPSFSNLRNGTMYQLQIGNAFNVWTNESAPFVATNSVMTYPKYWDVEDWHRGFFRLKIVE